jgi:hypothetical protein
MDPDAVNPQEKQSRSDTALELGNSPYSRKASEHFLFSFLERYQFNFSTRCFDSLNG